MMYINMEQIAYWNNHALPISVHSVEIFHNALVLGLGDPGYCRLLQMWSVRWYQFEKLEIIILS